MLCPYPEGVAAGQRLKYEQYLDDWRARGFRVDVAPFMTMAMWNVAYQKGHLVAKGAGALIGYLRRLRDLFRVNRYDLIYIHMWVTPFGSDLFETLVRKLAKAIVYDIEDNLLVGSAATTGADGKNPNPILVWLKGPNKARFLVAEADHVITSSPFLNADCVPLNRRTGATYISSSVDTERFLPATAYTNDDLVTIGWTGTFSSVPYLELIEPVLQALAKRVPYRLIVIGNFDYDLPGVDVEVIRWTSECEVADLQRFDIGVYPLPIDDWVLGKSGLKAIQYMAFGLPIVATDVGTTPLLIRDGENGLLVRTSDDWLEALEKLVRNPALRRRLGQAARIDAVGKYSIAAIADDYHDVLEKAMEPRR